MGGRHTGTLRVTGAWLTDPATQALFRVYAEAGFDLFAVGGCVRNALLDRPVADVDMASNARPDVATAFLTKAGFKVVPTGIDHGTITVISNSKPFEVTTFRKDVETDGRHAKVSFSNRIEDDARRRDFTINALYSDAAGEITDPVGGLDDIVAPEIRFIGSAQDRIREDYLRTLRFFRFHAWYAPVGAGFDPDALDAIAANLDGLPRLSRERVGAELVKLLSAPDPVPAVMVMNQVGALAQVLPGAEPKALGPVVHLEAQLCDSVDPMLRLASIATPEIAKTLRLSKAQLRSLTDLHRFAYGAQSPGEVGYRLGRVQALKALALRHGVFEQPLSGSEEQDVDLGANAEFPVKSGDISTQFKGKALGQKLHELEAEWIVSGFSKSKSQLLG